MHIHIHTHTHTYTHLRYSAGIFGISSPSSITTSPFSVLHVTYALSTRTVSKSVSIRCNTFFDTQNFFVAHFFTWKSWCWIWLVICYILYVICYLLCISRYLKWVYVYFLVNYMLCDIYHLLCSMCRMLLIRVLYYVLRFMRCTYVLCIMHYVLVC